MLTILIAGCANRGIGPQGGPKDTTPPKPRGSEPEMGALNFNGKRIEVTFDEYIQLDNVAQNLLMSPPQKTPPDVKARGKKLVVLLQDSLRDSTTYTIDFGNAVCDYREKVPLRNYSFYFSTGPTIDTLEYTGRVYDAATLNPMEGIFVGIHQSMEDSMFTTEPFLRVARTDSAGYFRIGNIHAGTYRLYAVDDISRDYRFSPGEAIAYADEPITPVLPLVLDTAVVTDSLLTDTLAADTLAMDTLAVDTLREPETKGATLMLFREEQQRLYLQRTIRDKQHHIQLYFSSTPDSLPALKPLTDTLNYFISYSPKCDTMTLWLLDSLSIAQDSLFFEARYRRTDSLYRLEWYTDTIRAIWRAPKMSARAKAAEERKNRNRRLELNANARSGFDIYDTLRLQCTTPIAAYEKDSFHLFERVDSILKPMKFSILPHDTLPMEIRFLSDFKPEGKYELHIDSGAIHDIYDITHIKGSYSLQMKSLSDYSTLRVKLNPYLPKARIQVLNNKDQVVRELPASPEGALFEYLKPDAYYMRLYLDENGDGKWTTGAWAEKRQPEPIYYFPEKIQTKSNWDFEEEWDYQAVEQMKAKPKELIQAAPKKK